MDARWEFKPAAHLLTFLKHTLGYWQQWFDLHCSVFPDRPRKLHCWSKFLKFFLAKNRKNSNISNWTVLSNHCRERQHFPEDVENLPESWYTLKWQNLKARGAQLNVKLEKFVLLFSLTEHEGQMNYMLRVINLSSSLKLSLNFKLVFPPLQSEMIITKPTKLLALSVLVIIPVLLVLPAN